MNKARRQWLERIISELEAKRDELIDMQAEEQDAFDNMPEGLQASERGTTIEENASDLDDAQSSIDDVISNLYEILER